MICVTRLNGVFLIGLKNYPRRCGENRRLVDDLDPRFGSSPQVRGKLAVQKTRDGEPRLIPAGAGKTLLLGLRSRTATAHPRRCGENSLFRKPVMVNRGSSPQVRGKLQHPNDSVKYRRLIPAGAGKTLSPSKLSLDTTAHPRRCGENGYSAQARLQEAGSSPQVRGKLCCWVCVQEQQRLIPAGAGKTV